MGIFDELQKASDEYKKLPDSRKPIIVGPSSKRLISDKELRDELELAFEAGVDYADQGARGKWAPNEPDAPDFDEWYEGVYGGPDCE